MKISLKKAVSALLSAGLVGAFGSGLWDVVVKPSGRLIGQAILNAFTFGSSAVKDGVYREAAKGLHEASAVSVLNFLSGVILLCPFVMLAITLILHYGLRRRHSKPSNEAPIDAQERSEPKISSYLIVQYCCILVVFFASSVSGISSLKVIQANDAFTFFSQSIAICRPFLEDRQVQIYQSRFASMRGRKDYLEITQELRQLAHDKGLQLPEYEPW